ncbi:MAG: ABC transporter ATP-binding protein [Planctomycetaceae bacterium]|nr:MAG: ABC transporter ATP-binding protein [Planctomycetaceae bacterium]
MLTVTGVTKRYGKLNAIENVDFSLAAGKVLAVIGPNGAGKTTLIKCLLGLVRFDGTVLVDGIDVGRDGHRARAKIGYLPQNPAFHADLTVAETALFYADLKSVSASRAHDGVTAVGLADHAHKKVGELSGGMRQRLGLAVAMLADPPLLILDEPATGLDMSARLELRRLVAEQRTSNHAVLLSTHWLEDVPYIADDVLALDRGKSVFFGSTKDSVAVTASASQLYIRVDGENTHAVELVKHVAPESVVTVMGDWIIVSCLASEKAKIVEHLVVAAIKVLDIRVEEAVSGQATFTLPTQVDGR